MMAHHETSIHKHIIALAEEEGLSASTAGELCSVWKSTATAWLQKSKRGGQVGTRRGMRLWCISSPAQGATLVAEAQINPFVSARDLKADTGFPGQKSMVILRLKKAALRVQHIEVKELFTDEINYTI